MYPRMVEANSPSKRFEVFLCLTMHDPCSERETKMKNGGVPLEMVDNLLTSAALPETGLVFRR